MNVQNYEFYMSNTTRRLARWFLVNLLIASVLSATSGRFFDPWLWTYLVVVALVGLYPAFALSDDLARERFRPPEPGADQTPLKVVRLLALAHVLIAALDQRWGWSDVPDGVRVVGLVGMAISVLLVFRAMMTNHYFSAVIRIQSERGHRVIDRGVYGVVRHPGYVSWFPLSAGIALGLGSLWALVPAGLSCLVLVLRAQWEDQTLQAELPGYQEYARRVRYKLLPGVW